MKKFITVLVLSIALFSCSKESSPVPADTNPHAYTYRVVGNSESYDVTITNDLLVPEGFANVPTGWEKNYTISGKVKLSITARNGNTGTATVQIVKDGRLVATAITYDPHGVVTATYEN